MQYRITRMKGGTALRTNEVIGSAEPPQVGLSFQLVGDPLDPIFNMRLVTTSPVMKIVPGEGTSLILHTRTGSEYLLEEV